MSQHDYDFANQVGSTFRTDLNNAMLAIVSQNSGATAPTATFAYMWWADTTAGLLKQRNAANTGWITLGAIADLGIQSGAQTWAAGSGTDTYTATLTPAPTAYVTGALYRTTLANANTSTTPTLNLNSLGAKTIKKNAPGGKAALVAGDISAAHECLFEYDGTNMILLNPVTFPLTSGTAVTASGTEVDFTGIPAWVTVITVLIKGVSSVGTTVPGIRIGDSGGVENSGYVSGAGGAGSTTSFVLFSTTFVSSDSMSSAVRLSLIDPSTNTWIASGTSVLHSTSATVAVAGVKSLTGPLDRIAVVASSAFDAGTINILYE